MPLPHHSTSHGRIAFGFFNIDSDMLLLERCFFFADLFCAAVEELCAAPSRVTLEGFRIDDPEQIGDLMGAIHGVRHTGFIGALYRRYPFPEEPAAFKQQPEGDRSQEEVRALILEYGASVSLELCHDAASGEISLAEYRFSPEGFAALLSYVWRGGYPRWRDELRPGYVTRMAASLRDGGAAALGLELDPAHSGAAIFAR